MKVVNGTTYKAETPDCVVSVLESARCSGERLRLFFGNAETGKPWNEEWHVTGRVGRSMGPQKIPILIANSRSIGGGALLDHCILAIKSKRGWLYKHEKFAPPETEVREEGGKFSLYLNGEVHARNLKSYEQAMRLAEFMRGDRLAK